jgi:cytoskeleton protein RodZ
MNSKNASLSFGRYLQAIRLEKGISLAEVSKETRIRLDNLLLIEKEDHENLPAQIFVKGFLRAYAKAIGADDKEALRRYEERYKSYQKVIKSEADLIQLRAGIWSNLRFVLGIIFCLIVLSVYIASLTISKSTLFGDRTSHQGLTNKPIGKDQAIGSSNVDASVAPINTDTQEKKLLLKVTAVKDTWMKVIVDGQSPEKFSLSAGDRLEFEAFSGFNLLIGDATGVNLLLNNKPYEVTGNIDQAVTIQIP